MDDSKKLDIYSMQAYSKKFVKDRNWDQYHTPKNIAIGLSIEASELVEIFQWLTDSQSFEIANDESKKNEVKDEIGDVLHYLIRLSDVLNINLHDAFWDKIRKTESKYPVVLAKGCTKKYSELNQPIH